MPDANQPKPTLPHRLLLEDGTERPVLVADESEPGAPYFRAWCEGWSGYLAADTARGAATKVGAHLERRPDGNGIGLPVVAVLGPGQGRPAFGPDLAALLAASPFIHDDALLHALRTQLVNGADVVAVVAQALLAYAELRRRALKEAERAVVRGAAGTAVVTLASLASHDPDLARAVFGIGITRTPETP